MLASCYKTLLQLLPAWKRDRGKRLSSHAFAATAAAAASSAGRRACGSAGACRGGIIAAVAAVGGAPAAATEELALRAALAQQPRDPTQGVHWWSVSVPLSSVIRWRGRK